MLEALERNTNNLSNIFILYIYIASRGRYYLFLGKYNGHIFVLNCSTGAGPGKSIVITLSGKFGL